MKLIAESGSTKTDWALITESTTLYFQTVGMNPNTYAIKLVEEELRYIQQKYTINPSVCINFFGSGCGTETNKLKIETLLHSIFHCRDISVQTDLEASAMALFGNRQGIVGILGTGANLCKWNGKEVEKKIPSLGYVFGDEGSGAYLGKKLLHDIYLQKFPDYILTDFNVAYKLNLSTVIEKVYHEKGASSFLASFVPFVEKHLDNEHMKTILTTGFVHFFENYLPFVYEGNMPIGFCGSVAFHFQDTLKSIAEELGFHEVKILKNALSGLVNQL